MISKKIIFFVLLVGSAGSISTVVFADTQMYATIEKTTYTYCERLVYTIEVSEVTGDLQSYISEMGQEDKAVQFQFQ